MINEKILFHGKSLYIADNKLGHRLNSNCIIKLKRIVSNETVYTNEFGWRISSPKYSKNKKSKYTFLGCSLCMGTGNEYEDSIVGQIEKKMNLKINNLGVGSFSLLQTALLLKENLHRLENTEIFILYGSWLTNRSIKEQAFPTIFRPILKFNTLKKKVVPLKPKNPPPIINSLYRFFTKLNSKINQAQTSFIILAVQKILIIIGFFFHGKLFNFFFTRLGLSKYKRLTLKFEDRERILNFCLNEFEQIGRNSKQKINILFFPGFFDLTGNLKKNDDMDRKIFNKFPKSPFLKFFMMKNLELKLKKFATPQQKKKVWWEDNNHPNKYGSKITAEEIVKILRTSKN